MAKYFCLAIQDIEDFLRNHPNADTFIPDKNCNYDADKLLYFITLLHNGRKNEVVQDIKNLKAKGHCCLFMIGLLEWIATISY